MTPEQKLAVRANNALVQAEKYAALAAKHPNDEQVALWRNFANIWAQDVLSNSFASQSQKETARAIAEQVQ